MINIKFEYEWNEICPIFFDNEKVFEQIGTGVLINILENVYLLTASHIIDELYKYKNSNLLIPTIDGFDRIAGTLYHRKLKENENRDNDKIDFSYYKLSSEIVKKLHYDIVPLKKDQIDFSNSFMFKDVDILEKNIKHKELYKFVKEIYSNQTLENKKIINEIDNYVCNTTIIFAGYPNTKSKSYNDVHQSEAVYYYARALSNKEYMNNNYDKNINILAEHGKYGVIDENFNLKTSPKPNGISGGGIYKIIRTNDGFDRKLIGIGHTYKKQKHLFIGININYCMHIIKSIEERQNYLKGKNSELHSTL